MAKSVRGTSSNSRDIGDITRLPTSLFRALLEYSADGLVVLNKWRQVVYMNPAAAELIDADNTSGLYCGALFQCHDDHEQPLMDDACFGRCVISNHQSLSNVEMNIMSKSGESIPVTATYSFIPTEAGETFLLMSLRNISDYKRLEKQRRQNEELHYTLKERERLARDLHDGVVQDIAYANMQTKLLVEDTEHGHPPEQQDLKRISDILEQSLSELRQAIYDLTFRVTEDFSEYVRRYLLAFETRSKIHVQFDHEALPQIEPYIASQIAKVLQEALANVRKHSAATHVKIGLTNVSDAEDLGRHFLTLSVSDNGCGFLVTERRDSEHYGLKTMKDRAALIGGQLTISSTIGSGTNVQVKVPLT